MGSAARDGEPSAAPAGRRGGDAGETSAAEGSRSALANCGGRGAAGAGATEESASGAGLKNGAG